MANENQNRRNINEASEDDLRKLPFMNEQRAKLITNYIDARGPITSAAQLDDIPNIGEKLSQLITDYYDFDDSGSSNRTASSSSSDDDSNRGSNNARKADDGDGRHNNPGRPAGIPRDAKYSESDDNDSNRGNGNNRTSR